jgi:prohibitin 2
MTQHSESGAAAMPRPSGWRRFKGWMRRHSPQLLLITLVVAAVFVFLIPDIFITIDSGQAGVLWRRFGGGTQTLAPGDRPFGGRIQADRSGEAMRLTEHADVYPYSEGMCVIFPWDRMTIYNIRLQQVSHVYDVLTSDGLDVKTEITIRWKPVEGDLGKLHRDIGPDYINTLIIPTIGAYAREEISHYEADALYSASRLSIQEAIRAKTKKALMSRYYPEQNRESYVIVSDVLIRSVVLPPAVRAAIEEKVAQKHLADSYKYRLLRESQEAERKSIEATGIQRFQTAVGGNVSAGYLRLRTIDALLDLAKSANAKIVVVGGGKDGLPLILGGDAQATRPP